MLVEYIVAAIVSEENEILKELLELYKQMGGVPQFKQDSLVKEWLEVVHGEALTADSEVDIHPEYKLNVP